MFFLNYEVRHEKYSQGSRRRGGEKCGRKLERNQNKVVEIYYGFQCCKVGFLPEIQWCTVGFKGTKVHSRRLADRQYYSPFTTMDNVVKGLIDNYGIKFSKRPQHWLVCSQDAIWYFTPVHVEIFVGVPTISASIVVQNIFGSNFAFDIRPLRNICRKSINFLFLINAR